MTLEYTTTWPESSFARPTAPFSLYPASYLSYNESRYQRTGLEIVRVVSPRKRFPLDLRKSSGLRTSRLLSPASVFVVLSVQHNLAGILARNARVTCT